jgi:hypothetical protein
MELKEKNEKLKRRRAIVLRATFEAWFAMQVDAIAQTKKSSGVAASCNVAVPAR